MLARFKALTSVLAIAVVILFVSSNGYAADNVRLTDNLEDYSSQIAIESSSLSAVEFNVDVEAVSINPDNLWGSDYQQVELPRGDNLIAGMAGEIGQPELPTLTTMIAIPDMAGITVTVNYESFEIIEDIDVMPAQIPEPEGGFTNPEPFSIDMATYNQDRFYPDILAEADTPVILRDVRMVQVAIYPVHYNPATRQLKIYRNISVDVSFEGEVVNPKTIRHNYISEAFYPLYKAYIANFDEYMSTLTTTEVKRGGLLIITPNLGGFMWADEMQEIANWKRQKGYDVVLATTHDVDPSDGKPTSAQLKSYIQSAYNNWEVPPEFVCLIGDEDLSYSGEVIPDYPYGYYASDHPYSLLEGNDYFPDVAVARASVDNINELNAWIAKVLKYEKDPEVFADPGYWRRAIMVAGGQQTETCVWTVLWTKERLHQVGFTQVDTVFDRGNDPPDYMITNPITAGVGYINYRGWAGSTGWYDPSYNNSALSQCQNVNKPGILTSIVCGTGNFGSYTDPCFGEVWIRMGSSSAPRGGPAFFGCTDGGTHTRWNNPITIGFYHGLLVEGIYHFGAAVIAAKLNQFQCFPREYSTIQQYFHTYNGLGDPELEMRLNIPQTMNVSSPAGIEQGVNNIEVSVIGSNLHPVEGAYVTLIMGEGEDESFFAVAKTDVDGYAILDVPTDTTGDLTLTITGRDLYPYINLINLHQADETVVINDFTVDDDMQGNNDGLASPTETIELSVELTNYGSVSTAENVVAQLVSADESIAVVHYDQANYGSIEPGQISTSDDVFVITIQPSVTDDENAAFLLNVVSDSNPIGWTSAVNIPVSAARFAVTDVDISDNGRLDPDETAELTIELTNMGQLDVNDVTGSLQTADGYIHVDLTTAEFGDIPAGETGNNSGSPTSVTVDAGTFEGKNVPFILYLTSGDGAVYQANFNLIVGTITASDPAGPDAYGYYAYDNMDISYPEHPTYDWMEIRGNGGVSLNLSEDDKVMRNLPFDFVYYGDTYDRITICSNGWICMDSTWWVAFRNWPLPDPSYAQGMIAGFWDDLWPYISDNVYTYSDTENHRYIIEWNNVKVRWNSYTRETFQIILYDPAYHQTITGDGVIEFVFNDVNNTDGGFGENYASVGWEDSSETIGFSISYSNIMTSGCATLADGRVYRITPNTGRGAVSGSITVNNGIPTDIVVKASTGQWTVISEGNIYSLYEVPIGQVDLTIAKPGWFPQTIGDVGILANRFTTEQDATLQQCPIPTNLAASEGLGDHVHVAWTEVSHGDIAGYDIYRSLFEDGIFTKLNETPVTGNSYDDYSTVDDKIYYYYVSAVYIGDDYEAVSLVSNIDSGSNSDITGVEDQVGLPEAFSLSQNYPNPFNAHTVLNYTLPAAGHVTLEIFNILGQKVNTLFDNYQEAGYKSVIWNGTDSSGKNVASGIYFYRLLSTTEQITRRMLMLK